MTDSRISRTGYSVHYWWEEYLAILNISTIHFSYLVQLFFSSFSSKYYIIQVCSYPNSPDLSVTSGFFTKLKWGDCLEQYDRSQGKYLKMSKTTLLQVTFWFILIGLVISGQIICMYGWMCVHQCACVYKQIINA